MTKILSKYFMYIIYLKVRDLRKMQDDSFHLWNMHKTCNNFVENPLK